MTRSTIGLVSHPRARRVERPEVDGDVALRSQHTLSFDRFRTTHISQPQLALGRTDSVAVRSPAARARERWT